MSAATGFLELLSAGTPSNLPAAKSATPVWLAAIGSLLVCLALAAAGQASILRIAIPACATLIGITLYFRRPIGYIHFTLWAWFVTAFVRRLVDWRFGYQDQSFVLLAPLLISSVAGLTFARERRNASGLNLTPFLLCLAGISYGFLVGIIRWRLDNQSSVTFAANIYALATWLPPLLFGLHLYIRRSNYEEQSRAIQRSFTVAVLVLGAYGVTQYVIAPPWDTAWLEGTGTNGLTFGTPEPFMIRVFSTANAPFAFASIMGTGLILLFVIRAPYKLIINAIGYISLLLSLVRTAWLGCLLGVVILLTSYRGPALRRGILAILILPTCFLPMMLVPQASTMLQDRLLTFTQLSEDQSFQDRQRLYQETTQQVFSDPAGQGLVQANEVSTLRSGIDSGILATPLKLGFTGAALLLLGVTAGAATMIKSKAYNIGRRRELLAYRAIFFATLAGIASSNIFIGVTGLILWVSLALWMSPASGMLERERSD